MPSQDLLRHHANPGQSGDLSGEKD